MFSMPAVNSIKTKLFVFVIFAVFLMCAIFSVIIFVMSQHNSRISSAASFQNSFSMLNQMIYNVQTDVKRDTGVLADSVESHKYDISTDSGRMLTSLLLSDLARLGNIGAAAVYDDSAKLAAFSFMLNGVYYSGYIRQNGQPVVMKNGITLADHSGFSAISDLLNNTSVPATGYTFFNLGGSLVIKYSQMKQTGKDGFYVMTAKYLDYDFMRQVADVTGMNATYYINGSTVFDSSFRPESSVSTLFPMKHINPADLIYNHDRCSFFQRWVITGDMFVDFGFSVPDTASVNIKRNILFGFAAIVLFSFAVVVPVIYFLLTRAVSRPLKELKEAVRKSESVDYTDHVTLKGVDEISALVGSYNDMISRIRQKESELEKINGRLETMVRQETTKRIKNEQLLFDQQKFVDMGQMVNAIAHQWRQPLNIIGLSVQSFLIDFRESRVSDEDAEVFEKNVMDMLMHMSNTIDDFRNFFRTDKTLKVFTLVMSVSEVMRIVSAQMKYNGITVNFVCRCGKATFTYQEDIGEKPTCDCEDTRIIGYPGEMKQAVLNIVQNAKDAILSRIGRGEINEGLLDVIVESDGEAIRLTVSDNGGGIEPQTITRIFEPYFTTKGDTGGTGIGLYMTKSIIEQHMHGKISVENRNDGAAFIITLPVYKGEDPDA